MEMIYLLESLFNNSVSSISFKSLLICSFLSIILGIIVAFIHKKTCRCNKNFLITLSLLPLLVQSVIIMINGNLGTSVAIMGAFGLIRFISLPGTSKEILSVFFSMTIGLATGMGCALYAIIITVVGSLFILLLYKVKLFDISNKEKVLEIVVSSELDYNVIFRDVFSMYVKKALLVSVNVRDNNLVLLKYKISINKNINERDFIFDLRVINSNLNICLYDNFSENEL